MGSNVEIICELYRAFKEKDYDAFKLICDESISWHQNPGFPGGGSYIGAEAVIEHVFKSFDDRWEAWTFKAIEFLDAGDVVIVYARTQKKFVSEAAHFYTVKNKRVVAFQQYCDTKPIWDAMD